ncbi:Fic family protein [Oxalobacteraceae bacterium CAVE-383]|nr:Fic family protein [Oxalobacteraceae bacterium CAVE-383]
MYDSPYQFSPLLPQSQLDALLERASDIIRASVALNSTAHHSARCGVRELVRSINSYYSNRIEGQGTHPSNIESALKHDFSKKPDVARLQRIALAHIEAERELEQIVEKGRSAMRSDFFIDAHKALYSRLSEADRTTKDGHIVQPGMLRTEMVKVGNHIPPAPESIPRFLASMDEEYDNQKGQERQLISIACLHHRAAWVHPFFDGNGRATRLQSHCALWPLSGGLWSTSRGLARARQEYYTKLNNADAHRQGDYDGRGNLTNAGLVEWVEFFFKICQDQVTFMNHMLDLDGMKKRIHALITLKSTTNKDIRSEAILPLYHLFSGGPLTRGEFTQLTGLEERTGRKILSELLKTGLIVSDSPRGPVSFGLPLDDLYILLPELYPEAHTKNVD